ncbi:5'-nucleotidase C-terminal domain-containing protein [Flavobacteriaceae bacterium]|nr:5'-nucleotidase C-terminal domain-containing protein [Flavobacteriaceae bacterium]
MKKIWILFFFSFLIVACKNNSYEVSKINAKQLKIGNEVKQDSSIIQLFTPYKKKMTNKITKSLSFSPKILERTDGNLQSTLGNLVADLSYEKANELFKNKTGKTVDFSMSNYGGIRAAIMKGDVTVSNAFELMPFDNTLVVVELNYDKIKALFNYFVAKKRAHPLSKNIQLTIKNDSYNVLINGKAIKKDKTYFVATSNYLQKGGDGMIFFSEPESLFDSNFLIRDAIVDYFESKDTLSANLDNRVIIN